MTLQGAVGKTALLVVILLVTAAYTWSQAAAGDASVVYGLLIAGLIGGIIMALVTIFFPRASPFTAPLYAALEGLVLGAISAVFETQYPGIVIQAVAVEKERSVAVLRNVGIVFSDPGLCRGHSFPGGSWWLHPHRADKIAP